ncbi:MAG: zinc metalloprotease HtpX [Candidatus Harrisonbacteria bacterium CG10_big_fil_rev_8_21_14_0_10_38_8]|uniref:Protease HtpX homolog n=1 Tax=Candidatus Harrisonbacteria bacterium CG10_big_fil_rev_8_21_14_0_10_38_8 TaxID=1974582 RepID=A0A2M6WJW0_9BACT|nr:MAG: zinc metalloprotease HtpX [Candidatus Harrisonbacteria bacterium CG10_big_fil_rev_8_21_14_0_10_38_8]
MASLYTHKEQNILKSWLLIFLFIGVVIGFGFAFSYIYNDSSILVIAIVISLVSSLSSYYYSDTVALAVSKAQKADERIYKEVHNILENLSITAGVKKPRLYIVESPQLNAFATGRNEENAAIAVTTGLLEKLDRSELEGVIAHELAHIGNKDILVSTIVVILVGLVAIVSDIFLRSLWFRDRGNSKSGGALILIGVALAILAPIVGTIIRLAVSRKREFLADATGAILTRYPEGLASALRKISADSTPLKSANNGTAHLWLADPFKKKRGLHTLFMTHPPIQQRIDALIKRN